MSTTTTDLDEFMRLPMIKISTTNIISDDESCISSSKIDQQKCHTPKSPQHMIPAVLTCPPAPKKPRRVSSCKRSRVSGLKFIEVVARDEIETFFRTVELGFNGGAKRKRAM